MVVAGSHTRSQLWRVVAIPKPGTALFTKTAVFIGDMGCFATDVLFIHASNLHLFVFFSFGQRYPTIASWTSHYTYTGTVRSSTSRRIVVHSFNYRQKKEIRKYRQRFSKTKRLKATKISIFWPPSALLENVTNFIISCRRCRVAAQVPHRYRPTRPQKKFLISDRIFNSVLSPFNHSA